MKKYIPLVIIVSLIAVFWFSGLAKQLTLDNFLNHKDQLNAYIVDNYILSVVIFMGVYVILVALSLPFASFMTLAGGFLFGGIIGTLAVSIGATIGATIIFFVAKSSFGETLRSKAGLLYNRIEKDMNENAASYLLFLRLVPLFPFFLVNIVPALFNIKTRTYILTTFFGILPGTAVYVNVGRSLGKIDNPTDLISKDTVIAIALLGFFALAPVIYQKIKRKK